jgi:porin
LGLRLFLIGFLIGQTLFAQKENIELEVVFTHDIAANLSGGVRQETVHLGNIDFTLQLQLWEKGTWFFYGLSNYGGALSAAVGDLMVTNNIEATPHTRLYEFGYQHQWEKLALTVGQNDLNAKFAISDYGLQFINSSFGIQPDLSSNAPFPIFPIAALGVVAEWQYSPKAKWLFGLYDGDPGAPPENRHSLNFSLGKEDGYLALAEGQINTTIGSQNGKFRTGVWHSGGSSTREALSGWYAILDQKLTSPAADANLGWAVFGQWGIAGANAPMFKSYFGLGTVYTGLFNTSSAPDVLGIAFAKANTSGPYQSLYPTTHFEGVVELTYAVSIANKWKVQPNLQWVLHPGASSTLKNALVGLVRLEYSLF